MRLLNIEYRTSTRSTKECATIDELTEINDYHNISWLHIKNINFNKDFHLPKSLQTLYLLNCNNIEHIVKLPNHIEYLNVNGCNCYSIDKWFQSDLLKLHSIHIKMNRLAFVPIIPQNVISLDISNNSIKKLPITNCFPQNIHSINLSDNLLEDLPAWLLDLNINTQIELYGNRFWFNHYDSISLNKPITMTLLQISDRYFNRRLTVNLLKIMKRSLPQEEYEQFLLDNPICETYLLQPNGGGRIITQPSIHVKKTTAEKEQNVHNSDIQDSFCDCVKIIMNCTEPYNPQYLDEVYQYYISDGDDKYYNIKFINLVRQLCILDSIVSRIGVKYHEIFERIWAMTSVHPYKIEIRQILKEDIYAARDVCFTGKVTKLVNALSGFIEGIYVGYSENEQINNRVIMIMREYVDSPELIKSKVKESLDELKIKEDKQIIWLNQFD